LLDLIDIGCESKRVLEFGEFVMLLCTIGFFRPHEICLFCFFIIDKDKRGFADATDIELFLRVVHNGEVTEALRGNTKKAMQLLLRASSPSRNSSASTNTRTTSSRPSSVCKTPSWTMYVAAPLPLLLLLLLLLRCNATLALLYPLLLTNNLLAFPRYPAPACPARRGGGTRPTSMQT